MKNSKLKYVIIIVTIIILLVIGLSIFKSIRIEEKKEIPKENDSVQDNIEETHIELMRCELNDKSNIQYYNAYYIEYIEVENDKVKTSEMKRKVIYLDEANYYGFKQFEQVINPIYDDANWTVEYNLYEKTNIYNENVNDYIEPLIEKGYQCEKVINN